MDISFHHFKCNLFIWHLIALLCFKILIIETITNLRQQKNHTHTFNKQLDINPNIIVIQEKTSPQRWWRMMLPLYEYKIYKCWMITLDKNNNISLVLLYFELLSPPFSSNDMACASPLFVFGSRPRRTV